MMPKTTSTPSAFNIWAMSSPPLMVGVSVEELVDGIDNLVSRASRSSVAAPITGRVEGPGVLR